MKNNRHKTYKIIISHSTIDNEIVVFIEKNGAFYDEAIFHKSEKLELEKYMLRTLFRIARDMYGVRE